MDPKAAAEHLVSRIQNIYPEASIARSWTYFAAIVSYLADAIGHSRQSGVVVDLREEDKGVLLWLEGRRVRVQRDIEGSQIEISRAGDPRSTQRFGIPLRSSDWLWVEKVGKAALDLLGR